MSAHLRLLIVTQYFWPENFRINELATELVRRGHEVTVLTGLPNYPGGSVFSSFVKNPKEFINYGGAHIIRVPMVARGSSKLFLALNYISFALSASVFGAMKLRGRNFDCIFTYQLSPLTVGLPAVLFRRIKKAPMIFWVQDLWPETLQALGIVRSEFILGLIGKLASFIYYRSDLILAQSRGFISQIKKYTFDSANILYFPNWAEDFGSKQPIRAAGEILVKPGCFNIMFAGNIGEAQDFASILSAAQRLIDHSNIRWLIVGDGRMMEWVKKEIKNRGLKEKVIMLGRHPSERMPSFFSHADALLVSLKDDPVFSMTVPSKLQTYLSMGKPIIAMLNGEGAKLIKSAQAGISCNAEDAEGLANAVLRLSRMTKEELIYMGERGKFLSLSEFHRDTLIDQLINAIRKLNSNIRIP